MVAGLTAAAVVLPKAMAYAAIAGLPLQVGLYTALVPMVVYALLGSSRPLSVSTTTTIAILSAAALGQALPNGGGEGELLAASATLAVLTGGILVLAFALRLGFVANFISEPVLTGFKSAIGLVIVVDQLPKLLGVHIDKTGFLRDGFAILRALPQTSLATLAVSALLLALIY
ncbi:MAG TPA: SulP family inorganic anion transporter, partial [Burkholderiales bacterium]|nr:SulP family inorganic anion transporter [Burkholderiales bacterium]